MPRRGRKSRNNATTAAEPSFVVAEDNDHEEEDNDDDNAYTNNNNQSQFTFSQIHPDTSQYLDSARDSERRKLDNLNPTARNQLVTDLSRTLLFKGLSGESIDKTKVVAEVLGDNSALKKERFQNALLLEAEARLNDVFGFTVRRIPKKMEEDLPARFKNRLYLINDVSDDADGTHSFNIHSAHVDSAVEKGVLMMVLAFSFCKGTSQVRSGTMKGAGKKTRWISEHHLYGLLHRVDEHIPAEPPSVEGKRRSRSSLGGGGGGRLLLDASGPDGGGVGQTPDIDVLLERFVALDYLLRDKIDQPDGRESSFAGEDGKVTAYAMGPRAAMEVGRKQVIYFCSNVLDEQPDPTMLNEVDEDEDQEEEEEGEEVQQEEEVVKEEPRSRKRSRK